MPAAGREVPVAKEHQELLALNLVTSWHVARPMRRGDGGGTSFGVLHSWALMPKVMRLSEHKMEDLRERTRLDPTNGSILVV